MAKDISYSNKDILMKHLARHFQGKSFQALGVNLPKIKSFMPIELPAVLAKEFRLDNLFELEDGSLLLVDYESSYKLEKMVEYCLYVSLVLTDYLRQKKVVCPIHVVIIYTADIHSAPNTLELGSMRLETQQVFLSKFDNDAMYEALRRKVENDEPLTDEDLICFSILPLTEPKKDKKQALIEKTVALAQRVSDVDLQLFILSHILVATDKFIDKVFADNLKGWISMTKVSQLFEEEKVEALNEQRRQFEVQQRRQLEEQRRQLEEQRQQLYEYKVNIVKKMTLDGEDFLRIMKYSELPKNEILNIQKAM